MSVLNENTIIGASAAGEYEIEQSLRFNDDDGSYLSRTPSTASNRRTWTWSGWVKLNGADNRTLFCANNPSSLGHMIRFYTNQLSILGYNGGFSYQLRTNQLFRDPSAWYHIVAAIDTTQSTASNRVKMYVNGEQVTSFSAETYPNQNFDTFVNTTNEHYLGVNNEGGLADYFDGYMGEVNFIDGQALTPDSFGETGDYGEWKPLKYTGAYGTNGFYLDFKNSGDLGNDAAGSNNWTPNNLAATDQMVDSPTNNFATWNALFEGGESSSSIYANTSLSEGNLKASVPTNSYMGNTMRPQSGTWYSEFLVSTVTVEIGWGWINAPEYSSNTANAGIANKWGGYYHGYAPADLRIYDETSQLGSNIALTISNGDILQLAWDIDNNKGWIGINNTWYAADNGTDGNPSAGTNQTFTFAGTEAANLQPYVANGAGTAAFVANFGQDSSFAGTKTPQGNQDSNGIGDFYYAPPTGFLALCSANLPSVDVIPSEHFNTVTWTGAGNASRSFTGVGFQPDFVWAKNRTGAANHLLYDSIRTAGANKELISNSTGAEGGSNPDAFDYLSSFDTDGFSSTWSGTNSAYYFNAISNNYVAWNWKAGGSAVSNTNGTITSQVSANPSAGFSIISYAGASNATSDSANNGGAYWTIGHGLSKAPELVLVRKRDGGTNNNSGWYMGHQGLSATPWVSGSHVVLNTTAANANDANILWGNTAPSSTLITIGAWNVVNHTISGTPFNYIAYAFHSVDGYSKVGSYTGNGSANGPFVHCGFKPAMIIFKVSSASGTNWMLLDNKRDPFNDDTPLYLHPDTSDADNANSGAPVDFVSNGFKVRTASSIRNPNGGTVIFIAFAENPFKHSNAR